MWLVLNPAKSPPFHFDQQRNRKENKMTRKEQLKEERKVVALYTMLELAEAFFYVHVYL